MVQSSHLPLPAPDSPDREPLTGKRGPLLFFLHDWFVDPTHEWEHQLPFFREHFRCYLYTLEGHGTQFHEEKHRLSILDRNYRNLEEMILSRPESVRLVAHGISCILALRLAHSYPRKIKAMVLINPRIHYRDQSLYAWVARAPRLFLPLYLLFHDPLGEHLPPIKRMKRRLAPVQIQAAGAYMKELSTLDLSPLLPEIKVRTFLLVGDQDPMGSLPFAEEMNDLFSSSHLIRYSSMGHSPHREGPEIINQQIYDFFKTSEGFLNRGLKQIKGFLKNLFRRQ